MPPPPPFLIFCLSPPSSIIHGCSTLTTVTNRSSVNVDLLLSLYTSRTESKISHHISSRRASIGASSSPAVAAPQTSQDWSIALDGSLSAAEQSQFVSVLDHFVFDGSNALLGVSSSSASVSVSPDSLGSLPKLILEGLRLSLLPPRKDVIDCVSSLITLNVDARFKASQSRSDKLSATLNCGSLHAIKWKVGVCYATDDPSVSSTPFVTLCLTVSTKDGRAAEGPGGGGGGMQGDRRLETHVFELSIEQFASLRARLEGIRREMSLA